MINIAVEDSPRDENVLSTLPWLGRILESLLGLSNLREIVLLIDIYEDFTMIDWRTWKAIGKILDRITVAIPELTKLEIELFDPDSDLTDSHWSDYRDTFEKLLPRRLKERELVVFTHCN